MHQIAPAEVPITTYWLYNTILFFTYLFFLYKNRKDNLFCCIITAAFMGMFKDIGVDNPMKIALLGWSIWEFIRCRAIEKIEHQWTMLFLIMFSVFFLSVAIIFHFDNPIMVLSQLSKTLVPICIYFTISKDVISNNNRLTMLFNLFGYIILAQIGFSIIKMILLGAFLEGWVGSLSGLHGAGSGTSFPLLGLTWLALASYMDIKNNKLWLFAIGLVIIGFAGGKRAIWLLFPISFGILYLFFNRDKIIKATTICCVSIPIILYLGLRISPTLNPDGKVWGSFDPKYAYDYIVHYSGGVDDDSLVEGSNNIQVGKGRVGAVLWLFAGEHTIIDNFFGKGLEYIIYASKEDYFNEDYYQGINYRGAITGIVRQYMMLGWPNIILFLLLIFSIFYFNRCGLSVIILSIMLFDFVFYNAQATDNSFMFTFALSLMLFSYYNKYKDNELLDCTRLA